MKAIRYNYMFASSSLLPFPKRHDMYAKTSNGYLYSSFHTINKHTYDHIELRVV